jgi:hypothetical protein
MQQKFVFNQLIRLTDAYERLIEIWLSYFCAFIHYLFSFNSKISAKNTILRK